MVGVRKAVLVSSLSHYATVLFTLVRVVVISRLLSPEEVGVYAIAIPIVFFVRMFRVFGTWDYIVARSEITQEILRVCFTISIILSLIMTIVFYSGADFFGSFFNSAQLPDVLKLMALTFLIFPFGVVSQALMQREMKFSQLAMVQLVTAFVETTTVIALAALDFGVMSLAWGFFVGSLASIGVVAVLDKRHVILKPKLKGCYSVLRFGTLSLLSNMMSQIGEQSPALIVGKILGAVEVGFFSRGQSSISIFKHAIESSTGKVAQSWFAQVSRVDGSQVQSIYLRVIRLSAGLAWPFYTFLFFNAATIIPLLLGDQWSRSIPIVQALAIGGVFAPYGFYGSKLLIGRGEMGYQFRYDLLAQGLRILLLLFAASYGILVFAWAAALSSFLNLIFMTVLLKMRVQLVFRDLIRALGQSLILMVFIAVPNWIAYAYIFENTNLDLLQFLIFGVVNGMFWLLSLAIINHELWQEILKLWALIRERFS